MSTRPIRVRKRGGFWWVEHYDYGARFYRWSSGHPSWREAMRFAIGGPR